MRRLIWFLFFLSSTSWAEYRVYQLKITDTKANKSKEVLTTLMPQQYIYYYPITVFETVQIVDHWMCWARSDGYKKLCTRPFASLGEGPKAGSESGKPAPLSP